jgi:hypothetical protein
MPDAKPKTAAQKKDEYILNLRTEIDRLWAENTALREGMKLQGVNYTLEMWEATGTQEMRDGFAARALAAEWGHYPRSLQRLGFQVINDAGQWKPKYVAMLAEKILDTPGVRQIMDRNLGTFEERWERIIKRSTEIAETGSDETALKAGQFLAKVKGLNKEGGTPPPPTISLAVLVNNNKGDSEVKVQQVETHDPLAILAHEPASEGVKVELPGDFKPGNEP